ncbi:Inositol phosphosphingolipids phospholipase C [Colletotrichum spinosum]|uniref:Inositol phosphosphingolipids phospholipase C n=1 Tax=Colletotrichum spinosum TaxID=1347390 RepID=A0A4R8PV47_9PEZI|nr:Inositol phosphosphingolipids phospholipase C [Colletotrichum spinosum]
MADGTRDDDLRVLTLNCWGLKYISKLRRERLSEIGRRIASLPSPPHIVALQECWTAADFASVRASTSHVLPYAKFYHSGCFGGGLALLSAHPIESSTMHAYPLNGRPTAFWRGDWFVGKGAAHAVVRLRLPSGRAQVLEIFNTHTHAPYTEHLADDTYHVHRLAQSWHLAKLLRAATASRSHLVLALGDYNMKPLSLPHRILTSRAPVVDTWRVLHPNSSLGAADDEAEKARGVPAPTARFNLVENGTTSDGSYNTWRWPASEQKRLSNGEKIDVPPDRIDRKGKRLDYVFLGSPPPDSLGGGWVVKDARVGMVEPHPTLHCSLSDHFAVEATLTYHTPQQTQASKSSSRYLDDQLAAMPPKNPALSTADYDEILSKTRWYVRREEKQKFWRGLHFFAWIGVLIACLVGVWFSPHNYVAFILMLLSSFGLVAGVVDGLLSLLFFKSELRALKEFEWEVTNAKALARRGSVETDAKANH